MSWTPEPPSLSAWTTAPPPDDTWSLVNQPTDAWDIESSSLHRIIETVGHRITEDGQRIIRIIERRHFEWTRENPTNPIWTTHDLLRS